MRKKEVFDDWMEYDEDQDGLVLREDAPEDIRKAYTEFNEENNRRIKNGERILK